MKKKLLVSILLLSLPSIAIGHTGIVKVLSAPLLRAPNNHATVVQSVRKADQVYLHPEQFLTTEFSLMGGPKDTGEELFYKTIDRNGNTAYIARKYVKVIYKDQRESKTSIAVQGTDETDYRLEEPLPKNYPLEESINGRGFFAFGMGPGHKTGYPYNSDVNAEKVSTQKGIVFTYLRNVPFDLTNRVFFGGRFQAYSDDTEYSFTDGNTSTESQGQVGLGPFISYDAWRSSEYRLAIASSITINYHRSLISRSSTIEGLSEERTFTGFSVTPIFTAFLQKREIVPDVDFIVGFDMHLTLPHHLKSSTAEVPELWNTDPNDDQVPVPFGGLYSFFLGIQSNF